MESDLRSLAVVYLKGAAMGTADAVPGVSGGTIALITGIYERLISALTAIGPGRILATVRGVVPGRRDEAVAALVEMDVPFLLALGSGMLTAIVLVTSSVEFAAKTYPLPTFGFFFGLIAASAVVLWDAVSLDTNGRRVAAFVGFALAFVVSGEAVAGLGHGPVTTFLAGAVAISAMILPGISGSLILLILGQYLFITGTLSSLREAVVGVATGSAPVSALFAPAATAVTFVAGAAVGLFTIAHVVRWALDHYHEATLAFLVSLIVGALRAPVFQMNASLAETGHSWTVDRVAVVAVVAVLGAAVVLGLDRLVDGVDY